MTEKKTTRLRYAIVSLIIFSLTPLCEKDSMLNGAHSTNAYLGQKITCAIDLGNDMYGSHGLETGFNYELLKRFAHDNDCEVSIISANGNENYIDSLRKGSIDIVITHDRDSLDSEGISVLRKVKDCSAWALSSTDPHKVRQINLWISHIMASEGYDALQKRFYSHSNPHKKAENGIISDRISPYDEVIRKYAASLGWDWRMLAAVIYQESRFSIGSRSFRGAQGLMQVMPQTGACYGIDDLFDPEQNIIAGTRHLGRLQNLMSGYGLEHDELIKFTLAAYNAGEGRIADCIRLAESKGADSRSWDGIVEIIPLMREDSILEDESVRLGKFHGHETIAYIENVLSHYEAICKVCPEA